LSFIFLAMIFSLLSLAVPVACTLADLPADSQTQVGLFMDISVKDKYRGVMGGRQFYGFLGKLAQRAGLDSRAEAVDYFWRYNDLGAIVESLPAESYFDAVAGRPVRTERMTQTVEALKAVGLSYLGLRRVPDGVRTKLPVEMEAGVLGWLPAEVSFKAMIQHRSFSSFLAMIQEYGLFQSRDEAIEFCWRFIKERSPGSLENTERFWLASAANDQPAIAEALAPLRDACIGLLALRHELIGMINFNGSLVIPDGPDFHSRYLAAGLLASFHLDDYDFGRTPIVDLSPLSNMRHIRRLYLHGTQVRDLTPISGLTNLRRLSLQGSPVVDLRPLVSLTNLRFLGVPAIPPRDLSPLAGQVAAGLEIQEIDLP